MSRTITRGYQNQPFSCILLHVVVALLVLLLLCSLLTVYVGFMDSRNSVCAKEQVPVDEEPEVGSEEIASVRPIYTALLFDTSGSMADYTKENIQRIDAAKIAAEEMLWLMRLNTGRRKQAAVPSSDRVALISFSTEAKVISGFTDDYEDIEKSIDGLAPEDFTNMGDALEKANELFNEVSGDVDYENAIKTMVVLSDGKNNQGYSDDKILSDVIPQSEKLGVTIYTVGFSEKEAEKDDDEKKTDELDEDFLKEVSSITGGVYYRASNAIELENAYLKSRLASLGNIYGEWAGAISQGEARSIGAAEISSNTEEIHAVLNWPVGSRLEWKIVDPEGRQVGPEYEGASIFQEGSRSCFVVNDPVEGVWDFSVVGAEIPEGSTQFWSVVIGRATPKEVPEESGNKSVALLFAIGGLFLLFVAILIIAIRKGRTVGPEPEQTMICPGCGMSLDASWIRCPSCFWSEREADAATVGPGEQSLVSPQLPASLPSASSQAEGYMTATGEVFGPECRLVVVQGAGQGGYYVIDIDLVTIGRDQKNHIVVDSDMVSGQHARLYRAEDGFFIEDLNSTNGTLINGDQVVTAWIGHGSRITIGQTTFELRFIEQS